MLGGSLWVVRTRASWRDLRAELGTWETAYRRNRLWRDTGLWHSITVVLRIDGTRDPLEVSL